MSDSSLRRIVILTGAGISKESGLDTFRDADGIWAKVRLEEVATPEAFNVDPAKVQAFYNARRRGLLDPKVAPNAAHRALALLEKNWPGQLLVVTQNIDNLHQASGIAPDHVVELHGNTTYARCLDCAQRFELAWVRQRFEAEGSAPDCPSCGGYIKTATVSFGQAMPEDAMRRAEDMTRACDLFLAIGSSLVVWPAAGFPLMAKRNGARLAIINREATDLDDIADLVVRDDIGAVLEPFITV